MHAIMDGPLAKLDSWEPGDRCSIVRALEVVGTRTALLILREAFYGTTRFDGFARRVGITDAAASTRLRELVAHGLLTKSPYQQPGRRTRFEYLLTEKGTDMLPVVLGLMQWGDKYLQPEGAPLEVVADTDGEPLQVAVTPAETSSVPLDGVRIRVARESDEPGGEI